MSLHDYNQFLILFKTVTCAHAGFFCPFWEHDPTARIGKFLRRFIQNWEKLNWEIYNQIKKTTNIWITFKILECKKTFAEMSQNGDELFFLVLELGIYSLKLGKNHTFCNWEHDPTSVIKMDQNKPWYVNRGGYVKTACILKPPLAFASCLCD